MQYNSKKCRHSLKVTIFYPGLRVTDETLRCNFICYCRQLGGAIAMEEMSAGNRCHLNMVCDNVPTALGGRGPTAGAF